MNAAPDLEDDRIDALREAMTMALYLSIVLLATFAALPAGEGSGEGVHGLGLVGLIWGTSIGLALAHWFAFRLTVEAFSGGVVSDKDLRIGLAQLAGAAVVATLCTIPVLVASDAADVQVTAFVPALLIGIAGYLVGRSGKRSRLRSIVVGAIAIYLGLAVAALKNFLAGH